MGRIIGWLISVIPCIFDDFIYGVKIHEKYMTRCIQLAKNGLGTTSPNPLVGSVIVHDDTIIGEGWHYKAGQPHAEVNAIINVKDSALLKDATIYVSLEPCSHYGKTPPCADLIIEKGIRKVVVGTTDPNPKVAGRGINKLMEAGCDVTVGVLEYECYELNKRFFTFQQQKRPYVILKWAQTTDGLIAPEIKEEKKPVWITNEISRQLTHKLRAEEDAILVGTNTVLEDNPSLTTRDWGGTSPHRVVIDKEGSLQDSLSVFTDAAPTLVITEMVRENHKHITYESVDFGKNIPEQICRVLYERNIQSLIVEGGSITLQSFIDVNLWDEALVFEGNAPFVKGIKAPKFIGDLIAISQVVNNSLFHYKNTDH